MYTLHKVCRACGYGGRQIAPDSKDQSFEKLVSVVNLGVQPLANDFRRDGESRAGFAPLEVLFCPRCTLAQLSVVVRPEILYSHYAYVTNKTTTIQNHFEDLWSAILRHVKPETLLEVGSNNGEFLKFARNRGVETVIGVEPAQNLLLQSCAAGAPTLPVFFSAEAAAVIAGRLPAFDLIVARHVFCHVDSWTDFMAAVSLCLKPDGLLVIEAPYCGDLLESVEFDTIYHEHLSYLTLRGIAALLDRTGFMLSGVERFPIHGGTFGLMIKKRTTHQVFSLPEENITQSDWFKFSSIQQERVGKLRDLVRTLVYDRHAKVCGVCASAKSTVWLNACGFMRREIQFVCDNTPEKQSTLCPGTSIPVLDEGALLRERPDYAVLFAWNWKQDILAKYQSWRDGGGKFIIPVPTIEIV